MIVLRMRANFPKLTRLRGNLQNELDVAVRRTAFKLQQKAVERLTKTVYAHNRKPTPTGALRASIYTRTHTSGNYRSAMQRATALRAKRDGSTNLGFIAPEVAKPGKGEAFVAVGMAYGVYIEFPTRGRPGTYYMAGARSDVQKYFEDEIKAAIARAGQGGAVPDDWEFVVDRFLTVK